MYSISFLSLRNAIDPLETARRIMKQEEDEPEDFQMDVFRVADAVERAWPTLIRDSDDYSPDDPTITFNVNDEANDFSIELFTLGANVTLPENRNAVLDEEFWSRLAACGEALQFHGDLTAYDPELDRLVRFPAEISVVRANYEQQRSSQSMLSPSSQGQVLTFPRVLIVMVLMVVAAYFAHVIAGVPVRSLIRFWIPTAFFFLVAAAAFLLFRKGRF